MDDYAEYIAELTVPDGSKLIGQRIRELHAVADKNDVAILGLIRDGKRRYGTAMNSALRAGDAMVLEATPDALDEFRTALSLGFADEKREGRLRADGDGVAVIEVVVTDQSRINGKNAQSIGLAWRQRSVLMGISRQGRKIKSQSARKSFKPAISCSCWSQAITRPM